MGIACISGQNYGKIESTTYAPIEERDKNRMIFLINQTYKNDITCQKTYKGSFLPDVPRNAICSISPQKNAVCSMIPFIYRSA